MISYPLLFFSAKTILLILKVAVIAWLSYFLLVSLALLLFYLYYQSRPSLYEKTSTSIRTHS